MHLHYVLLFLSLFLPSYLCSSPWHQLDLAERARGGGQRRKQAGCRLDAGLRHDCGYTSIDRSTCQERGCCYRRSRTEGVPWCFYGSDTIEDQCMLDNSERLECGSYGVTKQECVEEGCCWQPKNEADIPWCYHARRLPTYLGECGTPAFPPRVDMRIVGGVSSRAHSWPWQVSLNDSSEGHFCGGSIVNEEWIVSAAHCDYMFGGVVEGRTVVAGLHVLAEPDNYTQEVRIVEMIMHEEFDEYTYNNDIMLLRLETPLTFTDAVEPICLPEVDQSVESGTRVYATGWGRLGEFVATLPEELQQVKLPVISRDTCNGDDWYGGRALDTMICAGYEDGGRDACQGDSGGPLVAYLDERWVLAGVVSWGEGCGGRYKPGLYTDVSKYVEWIYSHAYAK